MISCCSVSRKFLYYPPPLNQDLRKKIITEYTHIDELNIPISSRVTLQGWFIRKDTDTLPTLLYFGGNAEEVTYLVDDFDQHIHANVALMNYRGYGGSTGSPKEKDLKSDARVIYEYVLSQYNIRPEQMVAAGRSLGSGIAFYLASEFSLSKAVLITPFDSIEKVAAHYYPRFLVRLFLTDTYQTLELCEDCLARTLILATRQDEVVPFERTQNLYDHIRGAKEMICIEGATHNSILKFDEAWQAMAQFIGSGS